MQERIAELERKLAAREKTIDVLMTRVENALNHETSSFVVLEQNIALERIVAQKTRLLEAQRSALERAVTELKAAQTQLLQAQKLEAIGQLAAGIAHEINTPTQYVCDNTTFLAKAFARLGDVLELAEELVATASEGEVTEELLAAAKKRLRRAKLDYLREQIPRAIEQSQDGLSRVATIVKAMKEFSHPSGGKKQRVDLAQAIETTLTVARNEWKYVAEMDMQFASDLPLVPCLRDELNQVVLNLVVNAAHAIAEVTEKGERGKGKITVGLGAVEGMAEITVTDTGGGIPEAARSRVFEPFFTTKVVGKGTGQGLAIAYSVVVDKHQGTIDFETETGRGTTFRVRIPLEEGATEQEGAP